MSKGQPIELKGKNGHYKFDPAQSLNLHGRFGSVFKGVDLTHGSRVVVKYYHARRGNQAAEFRFKAEALYAFGRPDIQDSLDFIDNWEGLFLIKRYIPGKTLKETKTDKVSFAQWKAVLSALCDTLEFLHRKEIVHADIKPANILWPGTGNGEPALPVLIDFGLARWKKLTYTDSLYSFIYSPPEQVLGFTELMGPASDLFALGTTVYESLTGEPPYGGAERTALEQAQLAAPLPPHDALPADWYALLAYLCEKPDFRQPYAQYSKEEQRRLVRESLERRPKGADEIKKRVSVLSTDHKRKSKWNIFG